MKLWIKYTLAASLGLLAALLVPENQFFDSTMSILAELSIRSGRFLLFPLLFFTLSVSICQLRRDHKLINILIKLTVMALLTAVIYTVLAVAMAFILPISRIPILTDSSGWESMIPFRNTLLQMNFLETLRQIIPLNAFAIFTGNFDFILPALLFAFLLGTQLYHDREEAEPVYNLFDSFSRMFYKMTTLYTKVLIIGLIPISYESIRHIRRISDLSAYGDLIRLVLLTAAIILVIIQPLAYFLLSRKNPFKEMKTFLPALIVSGFTADNFLNLLVLGRSLKENAGMKRKVTGLALPFLALFSRAGTAMVTAISMLTILKSYSSLELTAFQVFWVMGISILVSFFMFSQSYLGIYTTLITACALYGRGLSDGYILILPVLPLIVLIAAFIDTVNTAYITLLLGENKEFRIPEEEEDYI